MPVYDYKCPEHGVFHELATIAQGGDPKVCPQCRKLSARVIMIPPEVLAMAPNKRASIERNEAAKHQPIISTTDSRADVAERRAFDHKHGHQHGKGSCCSHEHASDKSALKQQVILLPDGSKVFPSQRPWMISH